MAFPKILLAVPLLVAGAFLPPLGAAPPAPRAGVIGMEHEFFSTDKVTVHRGDTLTLVNNSRWMHIIGPGRGGSLADVAEVPMHERALTEMNDAYTTARWNELGTYYLTCSMHPEMTVEVVVTECGCCSAGTCG
jgi:plastocyanin